MISVRADHGLTPTLRQGKLRLQFGSGRRA
jgi:hypothetical protein